VHGSARLARASRRFRRSGNLVGRLPLTIIPLDIEIRDDRGGVLRAAHQSRTAAGALVIATAIEQAADHSSRLIESGRQPSPFKYKGLITQL